MDYPLTGVDAHWVEIQATGAVELGPTSAGRQARQAFPRQQSSPTVEAAEGG
jgi:hypothetical protein